MCVCYNLPSHQLVWYHFESLWSHQHCESNETAVYHQNKAQFSCVQITGVQLSYQPILKREVDWHRTLWNTTYIVQFLVLRSFRWLLYTLYMFPGGEIIWDPVEDLCIFSGQSVAVIPLTLQGYRVKCLTQIKQDYANFFALSKNSHPTVCCNKYIAGTVDFPHWNPNWVCASGWFLLRWFIMRI